MNLVQGVFSGETPFTAEVYFVNTRDMIDMRWGTPEPISLRDPDLGLARLRAFGSYSMAVSDPQLFVTKIVGTMGLYQTSQISNYLRGMIISKLTDVLGESKKGLFDMAGMVDEISAAVRAKITDDFKLLGIAIKQFFVESVSPTEETQQAIDKRAAMGAVGAASVIEYQTGMAIGGIGQGAAQGGGGSGSPAETGMSLGAGMGMGAVANQRLVQDRGAQAAVDAVHKAVPHPLPGRRLQGNRPRGGVPRRTVCGQTTAGQRGRYRAIRPSAWRPPSGSRSKSAPPHCRKRSSRGCRDIRAASSPPGPRGDPRSRCRGRCRGVSH